MAMGCCTAGCISLAYVLTKLNLGFTHGIDQSLSQCGLGIASPPPWNCKVMVNMVLYK